MTNNKQQTEHRFCLTPELKCTMSYCDENGCINRQRHLVGDPIEMTNNKQQTAVDTTELAMKLYPFSNSERNAFITGYNKAKEMDNAKAFDIFKAGQDSMEEGGKGFEQYYEQKYGGGEQ